MMEDLLKFARENGWLDCECERDAKARQHVLLLRCCETHYRPLPQAMLKVLDEDVEDASDLIAGYLRTAILDLRPTCIGGHRSPA